MIADQIRLLKRVCDVRSAWRTEHALVFKDRPDYRFVLGEKGNVLEIVAEHRRIANRIVEESMIAANVCAALALRDSLGFGVYNGIPVLIRSVENAVTILQANDVEANAEVADCRASAHCAASLTHATAVPTAAFAVPTSQKSAPRRASTSVWVWKRMQPGLRRSVNTATW